MSEIFLLKKKIDRSVLERGFAVPVKLHAALSCHLRGGALAHGEKRTIKILLDGKSFEATLASFNFNRDKNPAHSEQWQIVYPKTSNLAARIRKIFSRQEYFMLHATDVKDMFYLAPSFEVDEPTLEKLLELSTLTDPQAALIERFGLTRYRKLNRELIDRLKRNYDYRCQICGRNVGEFYGVDLVECHHIEPFSQSLNNDATNLIIVCPNHHRIIHAAAPTFDRKRKLYLYPNGCTETLQLNEHL